MNKYFLFLYIYIVVQGKWNLMMLTKCKWKLGPFVLSFIFQTRNQFCEQESHTKMSTEVVFKPTLVRDLGQTGHLINLSHLPVDRNSNQRGFLQYLSGWQRHQFYHPIIRPQKNQWGEGNANPTLPVTPAENCLHWNSGGPEFIHGEIDFHEHVFNDFWERFFPWASTPCLVTCDRLVSWCVILCH